MNYSMNLGAWNSVFAVPCSIVDKHIKLAGSNPLKVLLWALRHAGEPFEAKNVAKAIGIDTADVNDAMLYWQQAGLIVMMDGEIVPDGSMMREPEISTPPENSEINTEPQPEEKLRKVLSRPQKADNAFVAKRINESTDIACLMQEAEQILGRLISNGDSATLLMIHDDFGLPADVITMLLQYVVSVGKANTRYIEKVAINWADEEIFTHDKAEAKLRRLAENSKAWHVVEQAINMPHRVPSAKEEAAAATWITEWHFNAALIHEAYDRGVDATGKFSPAYMNRILERWHKDGTTTLEQAQKEKEERISARKVDKPKKAASTYDIDEYEHSGVFDNFDRK